ncbi:hypothetical protein BJ165DRAFT_1128069 [Panaeolus papilionaceus]|nr:hypothetical protein BJ165DRAFT_1128069 [Panaeolus papilionaceus]
MHPENPFYDALQKAIRADLHRSPLNFGFPTRIIAVEDIELEDIVIGVFGARGSGKSTFIQALAEEIIFPVLPQRDPYEHSSIYCVQISIPSVKNHLILVELPGFGNAGVSDARTLSIIYAWFEALYNCNQGKRLNGAIFVDPITPTTSTSPSNQDLKILRKLYGDFHHESVMLVSTKWNQIPPNHRAAAQQRERQLITTSWRRFLDEHRPGLTARFDSHNKHTAFLHATEALSTLVGQMRSPRSGIELLIQQQVIVHGLPLYWTDAGKEVFTMEEIEQYREIVMTPVPTISGHGDDEEEHIVTSVDISLGDITDDDIIVGVFGETGVGKSSFVYALSNGAESSLCIGHHAPGTNDVTCVRVWIPQLKSHVVVVDTPGFNNPGRADVEVLETIAEWLVKL